MFYRTLGKRMLDLLGACVAFITLSPVMVIVAALIKIKLGSPVIFRQIRPGFNAKRFSLYKFRTMTDGRDEAGNLLPDIKRLTPVGEFLRRTSIDEFPELINVIKGEMSLIGPRPLLVRYLPYFSPQERARFTVRPGITGLAQVNGRNDLSWDSRLQKDIHYVKTLSLVNDITILLITALCVLRRCGYQKDPSARMLDFDAERKQCSVEKQ